MPDGKPKLGFLRSRQARILTAALIVQAVLFYTLSHGEAVPNPRPLSELSTQLGNWTMTREGVMEQAILDVLRADDTVNRIYEQSGTGRVAGLFVAYFKTQRTGQTPHSPKNCLPGSGWVPSASEVTAIPIPGEREPIRVNLYHVARGPQKSVVLYWYQTWHRVIASEYMAKIYLVTDAIRYNRSDTALVRVVIPVTNNDERKATKAAVEFVQSFFTPLRQFLPS
jgi:EpsI family protein